MPILLGTAGSVGKLEVNLDKYAGQDYVQLFFNAKGKTDGTMLFIDEIRLADEESAGVAGTLADAEAGAFWRQWRDRCHRNGLLSMGLFQQFPVIVVVFKDAHLMDGDLIELDRPLMLWHPCSMNTALRFSILERHISSLIEA